MPKIVRRLISAVRTAERLGNPLHVLRRRLLADDTELMTIVDKDTGVNCVCSIGAYHFFGETWYSKVYDVPGLPIREGDVVLDLGANHGFFTCYAASKGAIVYAFEPVPESYQRLVANIERNGFASRVTAVQCAVSHADGFAEMLVSDCHGGGYSTLLGPEFAKLAGARVAGRITVPCTTLARILDEYEIPSVRLCKVDVEGEELAMLSTLKAHYRARIQGFAIEYHPEGYDLNLLGKLLLAWNTHQVCLMSERPNVGNTLHLISNQALQSWLAEEKNRWPSPETNDDFQPALKDEVA